MCKPLQIHEYRKYDMNRNLDCTFTEIKAFDWRNMDLVGGLSIVGARISKTHSRRLVPILENLRTWLQAIAKPSERVLLNPDTCYRHQGAGISP